MSESRGSFDFLDTPGWDTWVWYAYDRQAVMRDYTASYLLAWIPLCLLDLVEAGNEANPVQCLSWADELLFEAQL